MKVALALHVGCVVQLYTLHVNLARFTCCNWVCGSDNCFVCLRVYGILIQLFFKINFIDQENHHNLCLPVGLSVGRSVSVCSAVCLPISNWCLELVYFNIYSLFFLCRLGNCPPDGDHELFWKIPSKVGLRLQGCSNRAGENNAPRLFPSYFQDSWPSSIPVTQRVDEALLWSVTRRCESRGGRATFAKTF